MSAVRFPPLPADTARATESAFGNDHPYLKIGQGLNDLLCGLHIATLESVDQSLMDSFWQYSLATLLQYWEDLTDHQMATATRVRMDLKYALHLPLNFPGIDSMALCRFRQHLLQNQVGREAFQEMVNRLANFVPNPSKRPTDVDEMLSTVCTLSRWEIVTETMSHAIEALAASQPEWLRSIALPHWYKRYDQIGPLFNHPRALEDVKAMLLSVGKDGQYLLRAIEKSGLPILMEIPEVGILYREWQCQFEQEGQQLNLCPVKCSLCRGGLKMLEEKKSGKKGGL